MYGPVITDPDDNAERGAGIILDNIGKISAIINILLFAQKKRIDFNPNQITHFLGH